MQVQELMTSTALTYREAEEFIEICNKLDLDFQERRLLENYLIRVTNGIYHSATGVHCTETTDGVKKYGY